MKNSKSSIPVLGTLDKSNKSKPLVEQRLAEFVEAALSAALSGALMNDSVDNKLPNRLPRLIKPGPDAKDQRWYFTFYLWDPRHGKLVRRRQYPNITETDPVKKEKAFREYGRHLAAQVPSLLHDPQGFRHGIEEHNLNVTRKAVTMKRAVQMVIEAKEKLRPKTVKNYRFHLGIFSEWLKISGLDKLQIDHFSRHDAEKFMTYLVVRRRQSPRSHNNYKSYLSTMFNYLMDAGFPIQNHFSKIPRLTEGIGRNIAYTKDQQREIIAFCEANFPEILPILYMMYYSLLRPNELCHLKVKNIGMYHTDKLYLPKEFSKNGFERHIAIHPELRRILNGLNYQDFPEDYYLFGWPDIKPSQKRYLPSTLSDRYARRVLKPLNLYNKGYTLYSWKHTGVVRAKRNDVPDAAIMLQAGWRDIKSYQTYLKSLGLEDNDDFIRMMPQL